MKISRELQELSARALEDGFEELGNGKHGLTPFVLMQTDGGEVGRHQFEGESIDEAIHLARQHVRQNSQLIARYAIVTLGFVSIARARREAMLVEAAEIGGDFVMTLAQGFRRKGLIRKRVRRVGEVAIFGRSETPLQFDYDENEDEFDEDE